jgi:nucleotide-binding universal stress UspA family protein
MRLSSVLTVPVKAPRLHIATACHEAARGARLLVLGSRGLSGIPGIVRGSVSQAILENTSSPVLVVPSRPPSRNHS